MAYQQRLEQATLIYIEANYKTHQLSHYCVPQGMHGISVANPISDLSTLIHCEIWVNTYYDLDRESFSICIKLCFILYLYECKTLALQFLRIATSNMGCIPFNKNVSSLVIILNIKFSFRLLLLLVTQYKRLKVILL